MKMKLLGAFPGSLCPVCVEGPCFHVPSLIQSQFSLGQPSTSSIPNFHENSDYNSSENDINVV
ncbi:hypothetical protein NQ314_013835 [Rhamnusium bicolor]|uniref:Uncharacterized protein n=1 Tax=Rhamnusium bicolor TaxID=1586634 RepID=A0AAV8X5C2_9CUCU|nr:hypothetical protein NQ314_013835 [Rhamnusium bicolor]